MTSSQMAGCMFSNNDNYNYSAALDEMFNEIMLTSNFKVTKILQILMRIKSKLKNDLYWVLILMRQQVRLRNWRGWSVEITD